jgi:RNA polymerase sigma-70 factor, ECF subfamily
MDEAYKAWRDALASGEGIEAASEKLFAQLRNLGKSVVWNTLRREDPQLVQDIVTRAFLKAKSFNGLSTFGTWFYRLAYNMCISDLRKQRVRKEVFLDDLLEEPVLPQKDSGGVIERLASLREHLSREDCELIDLRLEGYTLLEIAAKRGWSRVQIEVAWKACKRRIKHLLESK